MTDSSVHVFCYVRHAWRYLYQRDEMTTYVCECVSGTTRVIVCRRPNALNRLVLVWPRRETTQTKDTLRIRCVLSSIQRPTIEFYEFFSITVCIAGYVMSIDSCAAAKNNINIFFFLFNISIYSSIFVLFICFWPTYSTLANSMNNRGADSIAHGTLLEKFSEKYIKYWNRKLRIFWLFDL